MDLQGFLGALPHRRAALMIVLASAAAALLVPAKAPAATFTPVADAYVDASSPTANTGTKTSLRTDGSPIVNSYLRFNVQGIGAPAAAQLRVYAETSNSTGFQVRTVTGPDANTWGTRHPTARAARHLSSLSHAALPV